MEEKRNIEAYITKMSTAPHKEEQIEIREEVETGGYENKSYGLGATLEIKVLAHNNSTVVPKKDIVHVESSSSEPLTETASLVTESSADSAMDMSSVTVEPEGLCDATESV